MPQSPPPGLVPAITLLTLTSLALAGAATAGSPPAGNAAAGKAIYAVRCVACHKTDGSGGVPLGRTKTPNWTSPATWSEPKRKEVDAYLRNAITNGDLPKGMVPFVKSGQLTPAEAEHLIAHIRSFAKK